MPRLDPDLPLLWRAPDAVQIGADPRIVALDKLTPLAERLLAALDAGASRTALDTVAVAAGGVPADVDRLLARVSPALLHRPRRTEVDVVLDADRADVRERTARALAAVGVGVRVPTTPEADRAALVLLVAEHAVAPWRAAVWTGVDATHLAVTLGDQAATVGPLVVPGETPCLRCADEYRVDADPAWPALGAQLLGRGSAATTRHPPTLLASAAIIARAVEALRERRPTGLERTSLRIDRRTGAESRRTWAHHARCTCAVLRPLAAPEDPRRSARAAAPRPVPSPPTRPADDAVPA